MRYPQPPARVKWWRRRQAAKQERHAIVYIVDALRREDSRILSVIRLADAYQRSYRFRIPDELDLPPPA